MDLDTTSFRTLTIKPAYLVSGPITAVGGVVRSQRLNGTQREGNKVRREWTLTESIANSPDYKSGQRVVEKCKKLRNKACIKTVFGLVVAKDRLPVLLEAQGKIAGLVKQENERNGTCTIFAHFVRAEMVSDDKEAAQALTQELSGYFDTLQAAIKKADSKAIRNTVLQMKGMEALLPQGQSEALLKAVNTARKMATKIVKEVDKKGRDIETVKAELDLTDLDMARAAFLEVGPATPIITDDAPLAPGAGAVET